MHPYGCNDNTRASEMNKTFFYKNEHDYPQTVNDPLRYKSIRVLQIHNWDRLRGHMLT